MKRIVFIHLLLLCNISTFAQGWVTDDAVKDSSGGIFAGIFGLLLLLGLIWFIGHIMDKKSEYDDLRGKNKYDHLPSSSRIKPNQPTTEQDSIAINAQVEKENKKIEDEVKVQVEKIYSDALNILKTEYQSPFEYDGKTYEFKPNELKYNTITSFQLGYYWGVTRQMTYAPKEKIKRAVPHPIVRLGYERGLKSPQQSIGHSSNYSPMDAPRIYINGPNDYKFDDGYTLDYD